MTNLFLKLTARKAAAHPDPQNETLSRTIELMEYLRDCPFEPRRPHRLTH